MAIALALVGIWAYLALTPDRWWWPAQAAFWPLLILLFNRFFTSRTPSGEAGARMPSLGGPMEGPWGPP